MMTSKEVLVLIQRHAAEALIAETAYQLNPHRTEDDVHLAAEQKARYYTSVKAIQELSLGLSVDESFLPKTGNA